MDFRKQKTLKIPFKVDYNFTIRVDRAIMIKVDFTRIYKTEYQLISVHLSRAVNGIFFFFFEGVPIKLFTDYHRMKIPPTVSIF